MNKSVNLYLVSGISDGVGFWLIDFTEDEDVISSHNFNFLECYRKELIGIEAAIEVKDAINSTLDILSYDSGFEFYKLDNSTKAYSSEIPLYIIEDIFDLWAFNYKNRILWKKYIGFLNFRGKINKKNYYINLALKGNTYEFAMKLEKLLSFTPINSSVLTDRSNELMW